MIVGNALGNDLSPSDLLPHIEEQHEDPEEQQQAINFWTLHFARHNQRLNNVEH